jgi:urease accessory protein
MTVADGWWRILQLGDSAFPSGGFAHSAGLEAALRFGRVQGADSLDAFVQASLWNAGHAFLPFVGAAHARPCDVWPLDRRLDAQLTNHVANRASRTQGRAFLATSAAIFDEAAVVALADHARQERTIPVHFASIFGATLSAIAVKRDDALGLFLHTTLRGLLSAAVRLGVVGPHEGQRMQSRHRPTLDAVLERCADLRVDQAASTAPLLDIVGAMHDRQYARLFQS